MAIPDELTEKRLSSIGEVSAIPSIASRSCFLTLVQLLAYGVRDAACPISTG